MNLKYLPRCGEIVKLADDRFEAEVLGIVEGLVGLRWLDGAFRGAIEFVEPGEIRRVTK